MKTCPKCEYVNSDNNLFCLKCGTKLDGTSLRPPTQQARIEVVEQFRLLEENLTPAEGESEVKSYHCTSFKSALIRMKAEGYLVVTNKRVVFHAAGNSFAGKSILQSEVPIEEVSGINIYKGSYISFKHLLGALLFSAFFGGLVNGIFYTILYYVGRSMNQSLDAYKSLQANVQGAMWILAIGFLLASFFFARKNILRSAFVATSSSFFGEVGGLTLFSSLATSYLATGSISSSKAWILALSAVVGIYTAVCIFWYSRRPTMSLTVGSKAGSYTPIAISGISGFGIVNTSASKALSAEPAEDAETLLKELGALVMDIQILGDIGVNRWRTKPKDQATNSDAGRS
jgi:hypothetical protein